MTGVHTLDDLLDRCVVDSITECWKYRVQARPDRKKVWDPTVWLPGIKRTETVNRAAWILSGRVSAESRAWVVWRVCQTPHCCNPEHLRSGTRKTHGTWMKKTGHLRNNPERMAARRLHWLASGKTKITEEVANYIRTSDKSTRGLAREIGVSPSVVSGVRRGKTWTTAVNGGSVFSWKGVKP
jgi:hypothetical protein